MRSRSPSQIALHLDPQTLRILVAIEDYSSFSAAAAAVNLVPSAVSRRIHELESAVGLELVKRSSRSVKFTAAGERLLVRVRRILDEMNAAIADLDQIGQGLNGVLRIATSMFALHGALPNDLASLKNRYPGVELVFDTWPSLDIISATQRGEIDIGVFAASAPPEGLITRTYCSENVVLMIPKGHRLSGRESVDIQDLSEEDLLQLPSGTDIQQIMEEQGRRHGVRLHKSYRVGSLDAAVAMTRAGHGLAIVPRSSWESLGPFQGLTITPLNPEWSRTKLLVGIKASQPTSSLAHRVFMELATQSDA